jgi:group I intron endonuclease
MNVKNNYEFSYIYGLVDPRTGIVRYVGSSVNVEDRFKAHMKLWNLKEKTHKNNWIKNLLSEELKPIVVILEEVIFEEWREKEKFWISFFGRDNLTNGSDGGDGSPGLICSEETKEKISKANKGKKRSDEEKEKMRIRFLGNQIAKGTIRDPELVERTRIFMLGNTYSLGCKASDETKKKMSQNKIGRKLNTKNRTSDYIGVNYEKRRGKWISKIRINGKTKTLGAFDSELEAAKKYNEASIEIYGDTMPLNIFL